MKLNPSDHYYVPEDATFCDGSEVSPEIRGQAVRLVQDPGLEGDLDPGEPDRDGDVRVERLDGFHETYVRASDLQLLHPPRPASGSRVSASTETVEVRTFTLKLSEAEAAAVLRALDAESGTSGDELVSALATELFLAGVSR